MFRPRRCVANHMAPPGNKSGRVAPLVQTRQTTPAQTPCTTAAGAGERKGSTAMGMGMGMGMGREWISICYYDCMPNTTNTTVVTTMNLEICFANRQNHVRLIEKLTEMLNTNRYSNSTPPQTDWNTVIRPEMFLRK